VSSQSPPSSSPPDPGVNAPKRLDLDRYDAPRSYHASRAFAEMSVQRAQVAAAAKKKSARSKVWLAAIAIVVVSALAGAVLARHYV